MKIFAFIIPQHLDHMHNMNFGVCGGQGNMEEFSNCSGTCYPGRQKLHYELEGIGTSPGASI